MDHTSITIFIPLWLWLAPTLMNISTLSNKMNMYVLWNNPKYNKKINGTEVRDLIIYDMWSTIICRINNLNNYDLFIYPCSYSLITSIAYLPKYLLRFGWTKVTLMIMFSSQLLTKHGLYMILGFCFVILDTGWRNKSHSPFLSCSHLVLLDVK